MVILVRFLKTRIGSVNLRVWFLNVSQSFSSSQIVRNSLVCFTKHGIIKVNVIGPWCETELFVCPWFVYCGFHLIRRIQWIMKVQNCMVTRGSTRLSIDTLPVIVILRMFPLLHQVRYLMPFTTLGRCFTRNNKGNLPLLLHQRIWLDFVLIHWL